MTLTHEEIAALTNSGQAGPDATQVNNAYETLIKRCMESNGLLYYPLIQTAAVGPSSPPPLAGVPQAYIGMATREAGSYGFSDRATQPTPQPVGPDQPAGADPEDRYVAALPAAVQQKYLLALQGPDNS